MSTTQLLTEALAVAADGLHASAVSVGTGTTGAIDLGTFGQVLFVIDTGTLGASATVDFAVVGSSTSGGSYSAISGTSITQINASGKYALVLVTAEKIQSLGTGIRYIKGQVTVGTATSTVSILALGVLTDYEPASANNPAAVVQTVNLWR
ncbi:hypothetical protein [Singulisphaera sp. PoT]|uniref:hypothetical protein n=1 Tax=Singulisphaera sp. PoT TaxID=3411797 RepID=UPI003BF57003